jgi:hypothetical protein
MSAVGPTESVRAAGATSIWEQEMKWNGYSRHSALALALWLGFGSVQAATFTVDNAGSQDDGDALAPGNDDAVCDIDPTSAGAHCTLRAAIQEANDTPEIDTIVFDGGITSVVLTVGLPIATTPMIIDGANAGAVGQRVDINGNGTNAAFDFAPGAQGSTLRNLVIRNFNDDGVAVSGHGYTIENNYVGVTSTGLMASKNTGDGINITGVAGPPAYIPTLSLPTDLTNIVTITADLMAAFASVPRNAITGNLVSGNDGDGIEVYSENAAVNLISNNKVGTDATGMLAIPNGTGVGDGHGILINSFAYANVVGPGNLVSGNDSDPNSHGIALKAGAVRYPNFVAGNTVGPSSAIVSDLGNSADGIFVDTRPQTAIAPANPTGYAAFIGPGNIVGYNGGAVAIPGADQSNGAAAGIEIGGASANVRVFGNHIGIAEQPNAQGVFVDIGNHGDGINISSADHEIGGVTPIEANVVSHNERHGIAVRGASTSDVRIVGNIVGRDPLDVEDKPNDADGIRIYESSSVSIGGAAAGEGNVIAGNARHGVKIGAGSSGSSNLIARNAIFGNGGLGIDLDRDVDDPDPIPDPLGSDPNPAYANDGQNQPVICNGTNVVGCAAPFYDVDSGGTTLSWRLSSAPSTNYVLEVFANSAPDASGSGEGRHFIGSIAVTTDAAGEAGGSTPLVPPAALDTRGMFLSMTARDVTIIDPPGQASTGPANNSSEFSNAARVDVPGTLKFSAATYGVTEGGVTAAITVTRAGGDDGSVGVAYATTDDSADSPDDYASAVGMLQWADGETGDKTFLIDIVDDVLDEGDETVTLTLGVPTGGATLDAPSTAVLTIADNDPEPQISIGDVSMLEGQAGTSAFVFTVSLDAVSGRTVTVDVASVDDTATLGDNDYQQLTTTSLTFAPGEIAKQVQVLVNGDTTAEGNQTFFVGLSNAVNGTIADALGVGTIIDDETAVATIADVTVVEGSAGTSQIAFVVARSDATGTASVDVQIADGSATEADGDYVALPLTTLSFADGQSEAPVTVIVNGDLKFEPDETVLLNLSNAVNLVIGDSQGVGTIENDDVQPAISIADVQMSEGQAGTTVFEFDVSLSNPSAQTIAVTASSADDTATLADGDYLQLMPTVVTFMPGQTTQTVQVGVNGDAVVEGNERFLVNLSDAVAATIADAQGQGLIVDDEGPVLSIDDVTMTEGQSGTTALVFTVTRTPATGVSEVAVATADGTAAVADQDYVALPATVLQFADGESTKNVTVVVNGDQKFEDDETVSVMLSNVTGASLGDAQGLGTISNDDAQPVVSIANVSGYVGSASFVFTLTLSNPSAQPISVMVQTQDGTATAASGDYTAFGPTALTFAPGQTSLQFAITMGTISPGETFNVVLSQVTNGVLGEGTAIATALEGVVDPQVPVPALSREMLAVLVALMVLLGMSASRRHTASS